MSRHLVVFVRSMTASAIVFCVELAGVELLDLARVAPAIAFAVVQIVGTMLTFAFNKYWAFGARHTGRGLVEGVKSFVVFAGSFVLNIGLPSVGTYAWHVAPVVAFTASQVVVGLAWNFPLNRWWVFDATACTGSPC